MPLFTYKCITCNKTTELFISAEDQPKCEECKTELERVFVFSFSGRTWKGAKDNLENTIKPEVERIHERLSNNDDTTFCDICGDD